MDFLYSLDKALFLFINQTLSNPVGDFLWPLITDYDHLWKVSFLFPFPWFGGILFIPVSFSVSRVLLILAWLFLLINGGEKGRRAAIMIVPVLILSDQLSSSFIKSLVDRARPCHTVEGVPIIQSIHMLVDCGPGKSFPSSHAVNNFALATVFSFYYRKWIWWFVAWASLVALSRPAVGVHYPSDILGGAIIGVLVGAFVIWTWINVERKVLPLRYERDEKKRLP